MNSGWITTSTQGGAALFDEVWLVCDMCRDWTNHSGTEDRTNIIIMEYAVLNISMPGMFIAPLPIWSYMGLGLGSRNVVMNMY